jgi:hypothetical protein
VGVVVVWVGVLVVVVVVVVVVKVEAATVVVLLLVMERGMSVIRVEETILRCVMLRYVTLCYVVGDGDSRENKVCLTRV